MPTRKFLLLRAGPSRCALPVDFVIETMRPLPVAALAGAPRPVKGISIIRGAATPVVDLASALTGAEETAAGRFVTLRLGARQAAVRVASVEGVVELDERRLQELPPLLRASDRQTVAAISALDGELLMVLSAARLVPEEAWSALCPT